MTELNVKTTRQVIDAALGTENWDLIGLVITEAKVDFEKPIWVSHEEAQKEIEQVKTDEDKHAQILIKQRDRAEHIIEAAKTIMQEIPAYKFNAMGWEMYDRKEIDEWCNRLYAVLKSIDENKQTESKQ